MFGLFLRAAAIFIMALSVALSAQAYTEKKVERQKHVMSGTIDNMMQYKVMNGRFLGKSIEGRSGVFGGNINATARYEDENGGTCTVTVEKELGVLGMAGIYKLSNRCTIESKKGGTV